VSALLVVLLAPFAHDLVRPAGEGVFEVQQGTALALFDAPHQMQGQVFGTVMQSETGGVLSVKDVVGVRLWGIDAGNHVHALGLRNGDVIHTVDGAPVVSVSAVWLLTMAGRLRARVEAGQPIRGTLTRAGRRLAIEYRLVNAGAPGSAGSAHPRPPPTSRPAASPAFGRPAADPRPPAPGSGSP
jgi:S1-C subfamily serine protease